MSLKYFDPTPNGLQAGTNSNLRTRVKVLERLGVSGGGTTIIGGGPVGSAGGVLAGAFPSPVFDPARMTLTTGGQLQLPLTGSLAGVKIGGGPRLFESTGWTLAGRLVIDRRIHLMQTAPAIDPNGGQRLDGTNIALDTSGNIDGRYLTTNNNMGIHRLISNGQFLNGTNGYRGQEPGVTLTSSGTTATSTGTPFTGYIAAPTAPTAADAGAGVMGAGTYSYKVTFVTVKGETTEGSVSNNVTIAASRNVLLTGIPVGGGTVTARRIYRTNASNADGYKFVGAIADNTTVTFTDTYLDAWRSRTAPSQNLSGDVYKKIVAVKDVAGVFTTYEGYITAVPTSATATLGGSGQYALGMVNLLTGLFENLTVASNFSIDPGNINQDSVSSGNERSSFFHPYELNYAHKTEGSAVLMTLTGSVDDVALGGSADYAELYALGSHFTSQRLGALVGFSEYLPLIKSGRQPRLSGYSAFSDDENSYVSYNGRFGGNSPWEETGPRWIWIQNNHAANEGGTCIQIYGGVGSFRRIFSYEWAGIPRFVIDKNGYTGYGVRVGQGTNAELPARITLADGTTAAAGVQFGHDPLNGPVNLYRKAASILRLDFPAMPGGGLGLNVSAGGVGTALNTMFLGAGVIDTTTASGTAIFRSWNAITDTVPTFAVVSQGQLRWGPGASTAADVFLARSSASTLTVTGNLTVTGTISGGGAGVTDHAALTGLTSPTTDDDHPQYVLGGVSAAVGRAGGQIIYGGSAASENLTLGSTSHATKGKIIFGSLSAYDGVNSWLGLGTATPTARLTLVAGTTAAEGIAMGTVNLYEVASNRWRTDDSWGLNTSADPRGGAAGMGSDATPPAVLTSIFFDRLGTNSMISVAKASGSIFRSYTALGTVATAQEPRFQVSTVGGLAWGPGGVTGVDHTLSRSDATKMSFSVGLAVGGILYPEDDVSMGDGSNIVLATGTGTKIGTTTSQKLGFYNATPVVQQTLAAAATDAATTQTLANSLRTALINLGLGA